MIHLKTESHTFISPSPVLLVSTTAQKNEEESSESDSSLIFMTAGIIPLQEAIVIRAEIILYI